MLINVLKHPQNALMNFLVLLIMILTVKKFCIGNVLKYVLQIMVFFIKDKLNIFNFTSL